MQKKRKYDMVALRMLLDRIAEKEEQIGREWVKKVSLSKLTRKDLPITESRLFSSQRYA